MKKAKKILAIFMSALLMLCLCGCGGAAEDEPVSLNREQDIQDTVFDEENIVMTFGAISDIHLDGAYMAESSYNKSTTAFKTLQSLTTTGKLDAVLIAGDLVNCTNSMGNVFSNSEKYPGTREENYPIQSKAERDNFKKAVKDALPDEIPLFYCLGNHDSVNNNHVMDFINEFSGENNETFERYFGYDVNMEDTKQGRRHCIINGYHFYGIDLSSHGYAQATYDWLRGELDAVLKENENANIFLAAHYGPDFANTFNAEGEDTLKEFLKAYPQVITFYGHDHDLIQKETSIMQDESGYITLNCGSANYFSIANVTPGLDCINANKGYVEQNYGGYLVEIDKQGDIRVRRINFKTGTICADDWIIPAAKSGERELLHTADRADKVQKPYFKEGTELTVQQSKYSLHIGFDAAVCEDYIYYYEVKITNKQTNKLAQNFGITSRLFADSSKEEALDRFDVYGAVLEKGEYTVEVIPYDTYSNAGESLTAEISVE